MFETLSDYIVATPLTNFTRKYHAGVDNINVMPLDNVLLDDEVLALNKIFAMEYKRDVDQYRTQCTLDHNDDTYKELNNNLAPIIEESHKLAYDHSIKSDGIIETVYENKENNVYGVLYDIHGNSASNLQFFATDSSKHFLRGSLYFSQFKIIIVAINNFFVIF